MLIVNRVCVCESRAAGRCGAILADEMGLGKTLQGVALAWTLLRQGPYGGRPLAKRVLVVAPRRLVPNLAAALNQWPARARLTVFPLDTASLPPLPFSLSFPFPLSPRWKE